MSQQRQRDEYHHGDLRRALVEAAASLVVRHGVEGFSLREAAREAGVAASAPYKHFKDRAELLGAVAEEAWRLLMAMTERALEELGEDVEPLERYRLTGIVTVRFAVLYPAYFRVMNHPSYADPERSPVIAQIYAQSRALVASLLDNVTRAGALELDAQAAQLVAETLIYGLAWRILDGHFGELTLEEAERLAWLATQSLGVGLIQRG